MIFGNTRNGHYLAFELHRLILIAIHFIKTQKLSHENVLLGHTKMRRVELYSTRGACDAQSMFEIPDKAVVIKSSQKGNRYAKDSKTQSRNRPDSGTACFGVCPL